MSWKRIAVVTGWLALAGAVVGGVLGAVFMAGARVWMDGLHGLSAGMYDVLFGAAFCAVFGFVLGPVAAWMLMRHVPLWLAIGGTAFGTLAGMMYGLSTAVGMTYGPAMGIYLYPLLGFGISALALRLLVRPRRPALAPAEPPARLAGGDPG